MKIMKKIPHSKNFPEINPIADVTKYFFQKKFKIKKPIGIFCSYVFRLCTINLITFFLLSPK